MELGRLEQVAIINFDVFLSPKNCVWAEGLKSWVFRRCVWESYPGSHLVPLHPVHPLQVSILKRVFYIWSKCRRRRSRSRCCCASHAGLGMPWVGVLRGEDSRGVCAALHQLDKEPSGGTRR